MFTSEILRSFCFILLICISLTLSNDIEIEVVPDSEAIVGQSLKLSCKNIYLEDKWLTLVAWKKDGVALSWYIKETNTFHYNPTIAGVNLKYVYDDVYSIVLYNVDFDTSGNYTCAISNSFDKKTKVSSPKEIIVKKDKNDMDVKIITMITKPYLSSKLVVGAEMDLMCDFDMKVSEIQSILWMKDGIHFMTYDPKRRKYYSSIEVEGVEYDLSQSDGGNIYLKNLYKNTTGLYTCEIQSENGKKIGSKLVVVNEEPRYASIVMRYTYPTGTSTKSFVEGFEYQIECQANPITNSTVKEVLWYKSNSPFYRHVIGQTPEISRNEYSGLENTRVLSDYKIKNYYVTSRAAGRYMCEVIYEVHGEEMKKKLNLDGDLKYVSKIGIKDIRTRPDNRRVAEIPFYPQNNVSK